MTCVSSFSSRRTLVFESLSIAEHAAARPSAESVASTARLRLKNEPFFGFTCDTPLPRIIVISLGPANAAEADLVFSLARVGPIAEATLERRRTIVLVAAAADH